LRIINAGADTAFRVGVPDAQLKLTHTDGYPVIPQKADSVILGMGERVDAIVTVGASVPVIAVPYGKDGFAQLNLRVDAKPSTVNVQEYVKTLQRGSPVNTSTLTAAPDVVLPQRNPDTTIDLKLQGPMAGYTWPINGKLYDPPKNGIGLQRGKRVRVRFVSESMMFHPMHLHGHTFQVVTPTGPGPRKDTVLVPPKQTVEVDFDTDNPGRWIVHCHNEYHLDGGMATFVEYTG
jgi:FtsP/CotA-like multicopper oxidase with cupredoxin domain